MFGSTCPGAVNQPCVCNKGKLKEEATQRSELRSVLTPEVQS